MKSLVSMNITVQQDFIYKKRGKKGSSGMRNKEGLSEVALLWRQKQKLQDVLVFQGYPNRLPQTG